MDSLLEDLVVELYVIGSVKAHQRLATQQGPLRIEAPAGWAAWPIQVCRRMWYGESRVRSLDHVRTIVHRALHVLHTWAPTQGAIPWSKPMLLHAIQRAHDGLEEMKHTYADDAGMIASLDVLIASTSMALHSDEANREKNLE